MPPASHRPDCSSKGSSDSFSQDVRIGSSNLNAVRRLHQTPSTLTAQKKQRWDTELHIHDDWKEFRNQWWGPTGKTRLAGGDGTIITLEQETVWRTLVSYNFTQGQIYVRSEYELMYQRLCNAHKTVDAPSQRQIPGVILSGQPGIGAFSRLSAARVLTLSPPQGSRISACTFCFSAWLTNSPSSSSRT